MQLMLQPLGCEVTVTQSAEAALDLFERYSRSADINVDEQGPASTGLSNNNTDDMRRLALWDVLLSGGYTIIQQLLIGNLRFPPIWGFDHKYFFRSIVADQFQQPADRLWHHILQLKGWEQRVLAQAPEDFSHN